MRLEIKRPSADILPDGINNAEQRIQLVAGIKDCGGTDEEAGSFIPSDEELRVMHLRERESDHHAENTSFWRRTRVMQKQKLIPDKTFVYGPPNLDKKKGWFCSNFSKIFTSEKHQVSF